METYEEITKSAIVMRNALSEKDYKDAMVASILGVFKEIRRTSGALLSDLEISERIAARIVGNV